MSNLRGQQGEARRRRIRSEIEGALESGALRLEAAGGEQEIRTLGAAFAFFAKTVDVELAKGQPRVESDGQIKALLHRWEELAPDQFKDAWRDYATDPYIGVGKHWAGTVDEEAIAEWLASEHLAKHEEKYPCYSPRRVKLSGFNIVYLNRRRAVVTFRVEQEYQNGKVTVGNTAAILVDVADKGWQIMVDTKGGQVELKDG